MSTYTVFNPAFASLTIPGSFFVLRPEDRRHDLPASIRVATLVTLLGYSWDFFAIQLGT